MEIIGIPLLDLARNIANLDTKAFQESVNALLESERGVQEREWKKDGLDPDYVYARNSILEDYKHLVGLTKLRSIALRYFSLNYFCVSLFFVFCFVLWAVQ